MISVKYISYYENSGYGLVARFFISSLIESGINISWTPLQKFGFPRKKYQPYKGSIDWAEPLKDASFKDIEYDISFIHTVPELYPEWAERENGKILIGMSIWETTTLPSHWPNLINQLDYVIVPTEWNKKLYENNGVIIPIVVIPHLSQFEGDFGNGWNHREKKDNVFRFYTISTWTERKQMIKNVEAFLRAFDDNEPVELVIKTSQDDIMRPKWRIPKIMRQRYHSPRDTLREYLDNNDRSPNITIIADDHLTDTEIQQIHFEGDCFISLCRTEGWGMGAFDAAFYGKPIIMTGFGGQTDFLPQNKSWLVDYNLIPVVDIQAPHSYNSNQKWAEPDIDDASEKMRYIFENQKEAMKIGAELKSFMQEKFRKERTVQKLLEFIEQLSLKHGLVHL